MNGKLEFKVINGKWFVKVFLEFESVWFKINSIENSEWILEPSTPSDLLEEPAYPSISGGFGACFRLGAKNPVDEVRNLLAYEKQNSHRLQNDLEVETKITERLFSKMFPSRE